MVPERGRYLFVSDTDTLHARGNASPKQGAPSMQWSASTSGASVPLKSSERVRLHTVAYHGLAFRLPGWGLVSATDRISGAGFSLPAARATRGGHPLGGIRKRVGDAMLDEMHQPPAEVVARAYVDAEGYARMYADSIADPDAFWGEQGRRLDWIKPFTRVKNTSFDYHGVSIKWFEDGKLNVSANCIDRHLATRGDQTAIIWESDDPNVSEHISYRAAARRGLEARPTCC